MTLTLLTQHPLCAYNIKGTVKQIIYTITNIQLLQHNHERTNKRNDTKNKQ